MARTDSEIRKNIIEHLKWNPYLKHAEVDVSVREGVVDLSGAVDHDETRTLVEDAVSSVSGVQRIQNRLELVPHRRRGTAA